MIFQVGSLRLKTVFANVHVSVNLHQTWVCTSPAFSFVAMLASMYVISCGDKSKGNMAEECKHFKELFWVWDSVQLYHKTPRVCHSCRREENADLLPNEGKGHLECSLSSWDEPGLLLFKSMWLPKRKRDVLSCAHIWLKCMSRHWFRSVDFFFKCTKFLVSLNGISAVQENIICFKQISNSAVVFKCQ